MIVNKSRKILIIEDETNWQLIIARMLQKSDPMTEVRFAKNIIQAKRLLSNEHDFDLILADQFLDGEKTGLDFWQELGRSRKNIPYIMLSSLRQSDFAACADEYQSNEAPVFVRKPSSPSDLFAVLEKEISSALQYGAYQKAKSDKIKPSAFKNRMKLELGYWAFALSTILWFFLRYPL